MLIFWERKREAYEENYFPHLLYLVFADRCIVYMEL